MDNASKALIMAGAILLAVAIVGLGVYLFSLSQGLIDTAESSLSGLSITLQNNELLKYEGLRRGSEVRQLINSVNYLKNNWPETLDYDEDSIKATAGVKSGKLYDVVMTTDSTSGYVNSVKITEHTKSTGGSAGETK